MSIFHDLTTITEPSGKRLILEDNKNDETDVENDKTNNINGVLGRISFIISMIITPFIVFLSILVMWKLGIFEVVKSYILKLKKPKTILNDVEYGRVNTKCTKSNTFDSKTYEEIELKENKKYETVSNYIYVDRMTNRNNKQDNKRRRGNKGKNKKKRLVLDNYSQ